jgi:Cytidylate kinase-like family
MPVITISRLTGSGGATIGRQIADRLGASYLNTQIIQEVARRLGISEATASAYDERAEAFIERLSRVLWLANPGMVPMGISDTSLPFESTTQAFVGVTRQIIREAAQTGNPRPLYCTAGISS